MSKFWNCDNFEFRKPMAYVQFDDRVWTAPLIMSRYPLYSGESNWANNILPKNLVSLGKKLSGHTFCKYHSNDLHWSSLRSSFRSPTSNESTISLGILKYFMKKSFHSSSQTNAVRARFSFITWVEREFSQLIAFTFQRFKQNACFTSPTPPGNVYGELLRNRWATWLQAAISIRPPHCQIRNDISRLSPPLLKHSNNFLNICISCFEIACGESYHIFILSS